MPELQKDGGQKPKQTEIIVNGEPHTVPDGEISFEAVVALAYHGTPPTGEMILFTVTYRRGHGHKPEGSLLPGGTVRVKEGMIFNVTATDKS